MSKLIFRWEKQGKMSNPVRENYGIVNQHSNSRHC